jgi:SPP1 family predicted phage head-tail adaptor
MDIGRLNRRVVIQAQTSTVDAVGQPVNTWSTFAAVWADIRFNTGLKNLETITADAQSSVAVASIRIRYRSDVTSAMRVVDGSTVYHIKVVLPNIGAKDYTDLVCEVVNGG